MVTQREPPKASLSTTKPNSETTSSSRDIVFGAPTALRSNIAPFSRQQGQHPEASKWSSSGATKVASAPSGPQLVLQPASSYNPNIGRMPPPEVPKWPTEGSAAAPILLDKNYKHVHRPAPTFVAFGSTTTKQPIYQTNSDPSKEPNLIGYKESFPDGRVTYSSATGSEVMYGGTSTDQFVDSSQATESIKALLQGAVDEEDDEMPRTRSKRRVKKGESDGLDKELKQLEVSGDDAEAGSNKKKQPAKGVVEEEEDDEEEAVEEDDDDDEEEGFVDGLNVKLLPHQVEGLGWMMNKEIGKRKDGVIPKGGILADDMGLGKTLQSISLILSNSRPAPGSTDFQQQKLASGTEKATLVVAPLALIKQWEKELHDKVTSSRRLRVCVHHGPQRTKRYTDLKKYDVVITTYQVLVSEHGNSSAEDDGLKVGCFGVRWYRIILDEAHSIKNRNAKAALACYALQAQYRWCLTGTPMQNHLDELQSLIRFLRIKPYNNLSIWREQITNPMKAGRGAAALKRLQYYLKIFMKRRTKDVLKQEGALGPMDASKPGDGTGRNGFKITERRVEEVVADFSPRERHFYERLEERADERLEQMMGGKKMNYASALVLLLRLRQACNHALLVAGKLSGDMDALAVDAASRGPKTAASGKQKATDAKDVDDMADLLGGLAVEARSCEICQAELGRDVIASGAFRCDDCQADLGELKHGKSGKNKQGTKKKPDQAESAATGNGRSTCSRNRRQVLDSEDEDEEDSEPVESKVAEDTQADDDDGDDKPMKTEDIVRLAMKKEEPKESTQNIDGVAGDDSEPDEDDDDGDYDGPISTLTASTKIRRVLKLLHAESDEHKFIVFSQFTSMLDLIEPFLDRDGLVYARYDGKMRNDLREESLDRLRDEPETRVLLCSLKCGSLGLNLTAASRVIILEPFWNPFVEEQAIDRVHRLNQTVDVVVYKITIRATVEERILALQEKKRTLANAAVEGKNVGKLSLKDILELFRHDGTRPTEEVDVDFIRSYIRDPVLKAGASGSSSAAAPAASAASAAAAPSSVSAAGTSRARETHGLPKGRSEKTATDADSVYARRW